MVDSCENVTLDDNEKATIFSEQEPNVWNGYFEWELNEEKRVLAAKMMSTKTFPKPPEFQLEPLPKRNPILLGERWIAYHEALGGNIAKMPDYSWEKVKAEKAANMTHVLAFPYNGEANHEDLHNDPITPNEHHFVRNHGGVPKCIDVDQYTLTVEGLVHNPVKLTLAELKDLNRFPQRKMAITLQCAGTRRMEQVAEYPGDGDELLNAPWSEGAISNSVYTGVSLKKVLKIACGGITVDPKKAHCELFGADTYFKKGELYNYGVSIPYSKVRHDDVLLAWEMNGEPLPELHGFPLRVVVPWYIGARSVKWLTRIRVLDEPSWAPVQRKEYLYYSNMQVGKHNSLYSNGFSIQDMPVSSAILKPKNMNIIVHDGAIELQGWAYSGGENWVERVEVSLDGGHTWYSVPNEDISGKHYYTWRLWKTKVPCDAEGWIDAMVRAWDSCCNTQPTFVRSAWNWDLHVTSSCHKVKLYSVNRSKPLTARRLAQYKAHGLDFEKERITMPIPFEQQDMEEYKEYMRKYPREPVD